MFHGVALWTPTLYKRSATARVRMCESMLKIDLMDLNFSRCTSGRPVA